MKLPIGTPVTVAWENGEKENGIINRHHWQGYYVLLGVCGIDCGFRFDRVKIRYDSPAPFTLWQYYASYGVLPYLSSPMRSPVSHIAWYNMTFISTNPYDNIL